MNAEEWKEKYKNARKLLGSIGLIHAGADYTVEIVYRFKDRVAVTRTLNREINNQVADLCHGAML